MHSCTNKTPTSLQACVESDIVNQLADPGRSAPRVIVSRWGAIPRPTCTAAIGYHFRVWRENNYTSTCMYTGHVHTENPPKRRIYSPRSTGAKGWRKSLGLKPNTIVLGKQRLNFFFWSLREGKDLNKSSHLNLEKKLVGKKNTGDFFLAKRVRLTLLITASSCRLQKIYIFDSRHCTSVCLLFGSKWKNNWHMNPPISDFLVLGFHRRRHCQDSSNYLITTAVVWPGTQQSILHQA